MSHNEWPEGVTDDYYDPILGTWPYITWIDEEIDNDAWCKGSEELIQRMKDRGGFYIWSYIPTGTEPHISSSDDASGGTSSTDGSDPVQHEPK